MKRTNFRMTAIAALITSAFPRYGLALEVESLDKVEEALKPLYTKTDTGKFRLQVDGVEDVTALKSSLAASREDTKAERAKLKALMEQYNGVDPVKYKELLAHLHSSEEADLIKSGKLEEVVKMRTERMSTENAKALKAASDEKEKAQKLAKKFSDRVMDNHVRAAAAAAGVHASAVDDALMRARATFSLDEEGNAVKLGEDGKPVFGADGKSPFTPTEWMETMREAAPHWFPAGSGGGGAGGGSGGAGGAKTMKRSTFDSLGPVDKAAKMREGYKIVD